MPKLRSKLCWFTLSLSLGCGYFARGADIEAIKLTMVPTVIYEDENVFFTRFEYRNNSLQASSDVRVEFFLSPNTVFGDADDIKVYERTDPPLDGTRRRLPTIWNSSGLLVTTNSLPFGSYTAFMRVSTASDPNLANNVARLNGLRLATGFRPCSESVLSETAQTFSKEGQDSNGTTTQGSNTVLVVAGNSCAWTARSSVNWITILSPPSNSGFGLVDYRVASNSGPPRTGTITIGDQTLTITQNGCYYRPWTYGRWHGSAGGSDTITVLDTCTKGWTASVTSGAAWISITAGSSGWGNGTVDYQVSANPNNTYRVGTLNIAGSTFTIRQAPNGVLYKRGADTDWDADGRMDFVLYESKTGYWHWKTSSGEDSGYHHWGWKEATPVRGDFDGDGSGDAAVYDSAKGVWYLEFTGGGSTSIPWGWSGTKPVPGDYDGDGKTDVAVYYPATGEWYLRYSSTTATTKIKWGWTAAVPVQGDYDGDGKTDLAVYHAAAGDWYLRYSKGGSGKVHWGWSTATPVAADFDGDGKADVAVYDRMSGTWYVRFSSGGTVNLKWGWSGVTPVPGDYDGDGKTDFAVYDQASGDWYLRYFKGGSTKVHWGWSEVAPP
jgi:hypothetical protein